MQSFDLNYIIRTSPNKFSVSYSSSNPLFYMVGDTIHFMQRSDMSGSIASHS
jgi:hypothetical protein